MAPDFIIFLLSLPVTAMKLEAARITSAVSCSDVWPGKKKGYNYISVFYLTGLKWRGSYWGKVTSCITMYQSEMNSPVAHIYTPQRSSTDGCHLSVQQFRM